MSEKKLTLTAIHLAFFLDIKHQLLHTILDIIKIHHLNEEDLQSKTRLPAERITELLQGKIDDFDFEDLFYILACLGCPLTIDIRDRPEEELAPSPPGEIISQYLRGMNLDLAARQLHTSKNTLKQLLTGKEDITASMALHLAYLFNTTAEFWIRIQSQYDEYLSKTNGNNL